MKFRAVMTDLQCMREFYNIIITLSKLTKECVMTITSDKIFFTANEESGTIAPFVWVEIEAQKYFSDYKMAGYSKEYPQIMIAILPGNLGRAIAVFRNNVRNCKLKLTNIQFPCLSFEAIVISQSSDKTRQTVHDVPVSVIPRSDWVYYAAPQNPESNLILHIPSNRLIRGLIDKIKNLSPTVVFYATSAGELNLISETETATITARYNNLPIHGTHRQIDKSQSSDQIEVSCLIDCKKTSLFFSALQFPALEIFCGIVDSQLIHIEIIVRQGVILHTILPAISA